MRHVRVFKLVINTAITDVVEFDSTSTKKSRLQEYLAVAKLPDITDEEEREIDELGSQAHHRVWVCHVPITTAICSLTHL